MGRIIVTEDAMQGAGKMLNLSVATYLKSPHAQQDISESLKHFSHGFYSEKIALYATTIKAPGPGDKNLSTLEIMGLDSKGRAKYFHLKCDDLLQVKEGITTVDNPIADAAVIANIKATHFGTNQSKSSDAEIKSTIRPPSQ